LTWDRGKKVADHKSFTIATNMDLSHQVLITGVADDKRYALSDSPVEASRQIVKYDDALAGIGQFMDHVTADIACAASYKD
jgi:hypothetical protein